MRWIKEHKLIGVIAGAIIIGLVLFIASAATGGSTATGAVNRTYTVVEKPLVSFGNRISSNLRGIFAYREVVAENKKLKEENRKLKEENSKLEASANELQEMKELAKALNYDFVKSSSKIVTADIVTVNEGNWTNVFSIDRGTESGIKKGDVVVAGEGLVGRVQSTGKGWSKIVSLLDEKSRISFKVEGNLDLLGIVEGASNGRLTGFMLDSDAKVTEGTNIITSGMGVYPQGIKIGKITKTGYDSNRQLVEITVKPEVDFSDLDKVSVII